MRIFTISARMEKQGSSNKKMQRTGKPAADLGVSDGETMTVKVHYDRKINSANKMWGVVNRCHTLAVESGDGLGNSEDIEHHCLVGLVFTAFSVEAMLNLIGFRVIESWEEFEIKRPMDKLKTIYEKYDYEFDSSNGDEQFLSKLFRFRDENAHGKLRKIQGTKKASTNTSAEDVSKDLDQFCPDKWYNYCTFENFKKGIGVAQSVSKNILKITNLNINIFGHVGSGTYSIEK
jgi:hypothetical protein